MAPYSSALAWEIPWTEGPDGLQSVGSRRVGHDWVTSLSLFTFMHWRRKWQPTPVFLPGESQGWGAWWAAVCGVAQSLTRLKWLSSSSSRITVWLTVWESARLLSSVAVPSRMPTSDMGAPRFSTSLPALDAVCFYDSHPSGWEVAFDCGFDLCFSGNWRWCYSVGHVWLIVTHGL